MVSVALFDTRLWYLAFLYYRILNLKQAKLEPLIKFLPLVLDKLLLLLVKSPILNGCVFNIGQAVFETIATIVKLINTVSYAENNSFEIFCLWLKYGIMATMYLFIYFFRRRYQKANKKLLDGIVYWPRTLHISVVYLIWSLALPPRWIVLCDNGEYNIYCVEKG